jgi:two-component SAPR family response regulator
MKIEHIWIIDDDRIFRFAIERELQKVDMANRISMYDSPETALQELLNTQNSRPDIIFLDINMPIMDGWDFINTLLEHTYADSLPLIYMTSSSIDNCDTAKALSYKCVTGYVIKPVTREKIRTVLQDAIKIMEGKTKP